jgi:regulator of CtrA degradation
MQVASWLLVQRAVREGELPLIEAASDKYRLITREGPAGPALAGADDLPEALKALMGRAAGLYDRVKRLDLTMYDEDGETAVNPVSDQMAKLQAAFQK